MNRRHSVVAAVLLLAVVTLVGGVVRPTRAAADPAFATTTAITRDHLNADGTDDVVDRRTVSLSVSQTTALHGNQQIDVNWSGAHPTGGIVFDQNASSAAQEEYPMVLLECRGSDSPTVPPSQRLDPSTCWSQTASERYAFDNDSAFPAWRLDRYASPVDRRTLAGDVPTPFPDGCSRPTQTGAEHWLPFVAADGTKYYGGDGTGCDGMPPEAVAVADIGENTIPGNTTYGVTRTDGTGHAKFVVWSTDQNASLGCSIGVQCSLVAVPIMGLSCDAAAFGLPAADRPAPGSQATAADAECRQTGAFKPGDLATQTDNKEDKAVAGALWWSASNWRNRITVPLTFAPSTSVCSVLDSRTPLTLYGSELMSHATQQWAPAFCTDPTLFKFQHVHVAEGAARVALDSDSVQNNVEAALVADPPDGGYTKPTVNAPIGVTGFAISYAVDDAHGNEYTQLKLTPRLLAKLLTESYPGAQIVKTEYAALAKNPLDITVDPEFQALNPTISPTTQTEAAATLLSLSSASDVVFALTAYINADPEARAWLSGTPDPWGMVVNPNYRGIALPVDTWPLRDSFIPKSPGATKDSPGFNQCLFYDPVPYLPLIASPTSSLNLIAQDIQYAQPNTQTQCSTPNGLLPDGEKLTIPSRQFTGGRFMLGLTTLADADYYELDTAALQSTSTVTNVTKKFTDARNRSFVEPTEATMGNVVPLLRQQGDDWPIPYAMLRTTRGANAYPGTLVVYADVPTIGVRQPDAQELATFLRFAASGGQQPGAGNGQLPPGYLPMTAANGLGALVAATLRAADLVAAQGGGTPAQPPVGIGGSWLAAPPPVAGVPANGVPPATSPTVSPSGSPSAGVGSTAMTLRGRYRLAGGALPFIVAGGLAAWLIGLLFRIQDWVFAPLRRRPPRPESTPPASVLEAPREGAP